MRGTGSTQRNYIVPVVLTSTKMERSRRTSCSLSSSFDSCILNLGRLLCVNPDAGRRSLVVSLVYLQVQPDHSTIDHHITRSIQRRLSRKRMRFRLFTRIPYTVRLIGEISRRKSCCGRLSTQQEQCCSCPSEEPMQNSKERVNTLYSISRAYRLVLFYILTPVIITYVKQHLRASEDVGTGESIDPFGHLPIRC